MFEAGPIPADPSPLPTGDGDALFDLVVNVGLFPAASPATLPVPKIIYHLPQERPDMVATDKTLMSNLPLFCWPDVEGWVREEANASATSPSANETFSFLLTDHIGVKRFGYCRRVRCRESSLPSRSTSPTSFWRLGKSLVTPTNSTSPQSPKDTASQSAKAEVFCIISKTPTFYLFSQILEVAAAKRQNLEYPQHAEMAAYAFLKAAAEARLPKAPPMDLTVHLRTWSPLAPEDYATIGLRIAREEDNIGEDTESAVGTTDADSTVGSAQEVVPKAPRKKEILAQSAGRWGGRHGEHLNTPQLLLSLGLHPFLTLFTLTLLERRVILTSHSLSTLSTAAHSLQSLLYPLPYPHIFIPIVPTALIDVAASPTPYVLGVVKRDVQKILDNSVAGIEEVCVCDLDGGGFIRWDTKKQDENKVRDVARIGSLERKVQAVLLRCLEDSMEDAPLKGEKTAIVDQITEAFLSFFTELLAGYRRGFKKILIPLDPSQPPPANAWTQSSASSQNAPSANISPLRPTGPGNTPSLQAAAASLASGSKSAQPSPFRNSHPVQPRFQESLKFDSTQFLLARPFTKHDKHVRRLLSVIMSGQMWDEWVAQRESWVNKEVWVTTQRPPIASVSTTTPVAAPKEGQMPSRGANLSRQDTYTFERRLANLELSAAMHPPHHRKGAHGGSAAGGADLPPSTTAAASLHGTAAPSTGAGGSNTAPRASSPRRGYHAHHPTISGPIIFTDSDIEAAQNGTGPIGAFTRDRRASSNGSRYMLSAFAAQSTAASASSFQHSGTAPPTHHRHHSDHLGTVNESRSRGLDGSSGFFLSGNTIGSNSSAHGMPVSGSVDKLSSCDSISTVDDEEEDNQPLATMKETLSAQKAAAVEDNKPLRRLAPPAQSHSSHISQISGPPPQNPHAQSGGVISSLFSRHSWPYKAAQ